MTDTSARSGGARNHVVCASLGLTLMVLIIAAMVLQLRTAVTSLAPSALMQDGWTNSQIASLFAFVGAFTWAILILLALGATYIGAKRHMGWFTFVMSAGGRASRSQYWLSCWLPLTLAALLAVLPVGAAAYFAAFLFVGDPQDAAALAMSLTLPHAVMIDLLLLWPSLAALIKRLHDRGKSGWFVLIGLIPILGQIWLLIEIGFLPGQRGDNRYGPDPLASGAPID
jgi:uncharacterized membrane protein YhaH (DUF805 family)